MFGAVRLHSASTDSSSNGSGSLANRMSTERIGAGMHTAYSFSRRVEGPGRALFRLSSRFGLTVRSRCESSASETSLEGAKSSSFLRHREKQGEFDNIGIGSKQARFRFPFRDICGPIHDVCMSRLVIAVSSEPASRKLLTRLGDGALSEAVRLARALAVQILSARHKGHATPEGRLSWNIQMFCPLPGSLQFRLMESRPLDDESMRPNRQPALKYFEAVDFE